MLSWGPETNVHRLWVEMAIGALGGGAIITSLLSESAAPLYSLRYRCPVLDSISLLRSGPAPPRSRPNPRQSLSFLLMSLNNGLPQTRVHYAYHNLAASLSLTL